MKAKVRKVNIIKALKEELRHYKDLNHLRLKALFSREEVANMPRDVIPELLQIKLSKAFADNINKLPIETEYDENEDIYKARLDIWVKPKHGPWEVNR